MKGLAAASAVSITLVAALPVAAQDRSMQGMDMSGMKMPAGVKKKPKTVSKPKAKPAADSATAMPGTDHGSMPGMDMSASGQPTQNAQPSIPGMQKQAEGRADQEMEAMPGMASEGVAQTGTALPAGNAPPPPIPTDHAADRVFPAQVMVHARQHLNMHGGQTFSQVLFNLAEYEARKGGDGYRWDAEAWWGGDINRLWLKSEGEGRSRSGVDAAEVQALYGRAIGPYFNLQAGVRQDLKPSSRTYLTVGTEGLAPDFFEVGGALFLSTKGELLGRVEGYQHLRITQRLVLQPRVELNLAAQNTLETRTGSGLSEAEVGLRLRYELRREFAPYVGVSYQGRFGRTADFARAAGEDVRGVSFTVGVRAWF